MEDDRERIVSHLTFEQCVEDLKDVIHAAGPKAVLVGHSFGGITAMKAADDKNISAH